MATPRIRSIRVETLANFRLLAMAGTVSSCPRPTLKLSRVQWAGSTVPYQSLAQATRMTPRWGRTARRVTPAKRQVQSQAWRGGRERAPEEAVALVDMTRALRPKRPLPTP